MIVSIDGPAGSGKSTVARLLAKKLGFIHFNSGSLYRGITAHILTNNIQHINSESDIQLELKFIASVQHVYVNGIDYTDRLRDNEISNATAMISINPIVRNVVDNCQRSFCNNNNCVIDGRDIGSYVFPNAEYKFYLDCSIAERARRRYLEEMRVNNNISLSQIEKEIRMRDEIDRSKKIAPLVIPKNAIIIDSTNLSINEVVDKMYNIIHKVP